MKQKTQFVGMEVGKPIEINWNKTGKDMDFGDLDDVIDEEGAVEIKRKGTKKFTHTSQDPDFL